MRYIYTSISILAICGTIIFTNGCSGSEEFGSSEFGAAKVEVRDILEDPVSFDGMEVRVEGEILNECPSGCWIDLADDTAVVYVDMNPSGFAIPQSTGKRAEVQGKVGIKEGKTRIIAEGVRVK